MNNLILKAIARPEQPGNFKETGFVQGVIYGKGIDSSAVKLDEAMLNKIIATGGRKSAVTVDFAGVTMTGVLKEVQIAVMDQTVSHVDIHILG